MPADPRQTTEDQGLEQAVEQAIDYLEGEIGELMKAVSRAYVRGRFQSYSG